LNKKKTNHHPQIKLSLLRLKRRSQSRTSWKISQRDQDLAHHTGDPKALQDLIKEIETTDTATTVSREDIAEKEVTDAIQGTEMTEGTIRKKGIESDLQGKKFQRKK